MRVGRTTIVSNEQPSKKCVPFYLLKPILFLHVRMDQYKGETLVVF
jgi:hypothetical protein